MTAEPDLTDRLRWRTPPEWLQAVSGDLIAFLQDHAANERKVAVSALTLAVRNPMRHELVAPLVPVAQEELDHFHRIYRLLRARGAGLAWDAPHPYIGSLRKAARDPDVETYLLNQLLVFALIEARGAERFGILGRQLEDEELRGFYSQLERCEARHRALYLGLAHKLFRDRQLETRLDKLLDLEARTISDLPVRPALY
jgi:tRNA-(ms[2]io[6]A)-hydroxylase